MASANACHHDDSSDVDNCTCTKLDSISKRCKSKNHRCRCIFEYADDEGDKVIFFDERFKDSSDYYSYYHYNNECPATEHYCSCKIILRSRDNLRIIKKYIRYTNQRIIKYNRNGDIEIKNIVRKTINEHQMYEFSDNIKCKSNGKHSCICISEENSEKIPYTDEYTAMVYAPFVCQAEEHPCIKKNWSDRTTDKVCRCIECNLEHGSRTKRAIREEDNLTQEDDLTQKNEMPPLDGISIDEDDLI
jgi:hypothetical protein